MLPAVGVANVAADQADWCYAGTAGPKRVGRIGHLGPLADASGPNVILMLIRALRALNAAPRFARRLTHPSGQAVRLCGAYSRPVDAQRGASLRSARNATMWQLAGCVFWERPGRIASSRTKNFSLNRDPQPLGRRLAGEIRVGESSDHP